MNIWFSAHHTAPELCNEAGAGQFMTDSLPLTAWSQEVPVNCDTCYFCFDLAFVWPSLGRADFHSAKLVNPFRVFVRVPELVGDACQ